MNFMTIPLIENTPLNYVLFLFQVGEFIPQLLETSGGSIEIFFPMSHGSVFLPTSILAADRMWKGHFRCCILAGYNSTNYEKKTNHISVINLGSPRTLIAHEIQYRFLITRDNLAEHQFLKTPVKLWCKSSWTY